LSRKGQKIRANSRKFVAKLTLESITPWNPVEPLFFDNIYFITVAQCGKRVDTTVSPCYHKFNFHLVKENLIRKQAVKGQAVLNSHVIPYSSPRPAFSMIPACDFLSGRWVLAKRPFCIKINYFCTGQE